MTTQVEKLEFKMSHKKKREDIQGLRAVAIIMVLLFHFFPDSFPNGYVGVDIFFVISGYIISMVFPKELSKTKLLDFYNRRVKRILPLYFLVIFSLLISLILFAPVNILNVNLGSGQRATLLISNIVIAQSQELNYQRLILNAEDLFTHCWSLCLEMQWYLLAPIVFLFTSSRILFFALTISLIHYITTDENTAFNCVFARLWQFLSGIIAYELFRLKSLKLQTNESEKLPLVKETKHCNAIISMLMLSRLLLIPLAFGFIPSKQDPTVLRGLLTFSTSALLFTGATVEVPLLRNSVLCWIGNISYSLYLVHWPIYVVLKSFDSIAVLFLGLQLSLVLAALVYKFFEQKYLKWEKSTVLITVGFLFSASIFLSLKGENLHRWMKSEMAPEDFLSFERSDTPWLAINIAEGGLPNNTNNLANPICGTYEPLFGIYTVPPLGHCQMPDGNGSYNVLILGNSYAANQGYMIYKKFSKFAKKFDIYSVVGCEPLKKTTSPLCDNFPDYGKLAVDRFKPDILFLMVRFITAADPITAEKIDDDPIFQEFLDHLTYYEKTAKKIYIQQALPWCNVACTTVPVTEMWKASKNLSELGDKYILRDEYYPRVRLRELAKRCKNCELIDFLPYYPLTSDNHPVPYDLKRNLIFLDDQVHLNKFGKEWLQPIFDEIADNFTMF